MEIIEVESPSDIEERKRSIKHYQKIATILDSQFVIPGTSIRFGIDAIIGLFPGIGDILGLVLSLYIVYGAARLGVSTPTLLRMLFNISADSIVGVVPFLGDIFDVVHKANLSNVRILRNANLDGNQNARTPEAVRRLTKLIFILASIILLAISSLFACGVIYLITQL